MLRRALLIFLIFALSILAGYMVAASTVSSPTYADTSKEYGIGYEAILQYGGQNITLASTNASLDTGPRVGGIEVYNDLGNASLIVQPPPETQTVTQTYTYTTTITKTVTLPNGETTVVTEVQTVTMPGQQGHPRAVLMGLGVIALLLFLLTRLR